MDLGLAIKTRLRDLALEQKDLAAAAQVTESYVSQLLTGKKPPPAPDRTDIYEKMGKFLQLSNGELEKLARAQRLDEFRRSHEPQQGALLAQTRELILRKCVATKQQQVRLVFERHAFGELERLVTQKLLDVVSVVARSELGNQAWLREVAQLGEKSHEQMRVIVLEFLDTDIFSISNDDCVSFLDPLITRWDIDLATFEMEVVLNKQLAPAEPKVFAFVEKERGSQSADEPGLIAFLQDPLLSSDLTDEELGVLQRLTFNTKRPNRIFYYRALQNLRDPLNFMAADDLPV